MPKLKFKEHAKKEKHSSHRHDKHRSSSKSKRKEKSYKPPTLFEEESGWVPPSSSQKHHDDEASWREHLFDAMIDDEGQDPFYTQYQQPTPKDTMTDEEYRQHIVHGMYRRTHAEEIAAEERREAHREKKRKEKERIKLEQERSHAEHIRLQNVYIQLEALRKKESNLADYIEKWKRLETLDTIHRKDIPWPILDKTFSLTSVKSFVIDPKATPADNKKNVRKEQTRYHPDKFITRYMRKFKGSEKERERVIVHVNEISGWLNEIWTGLNN
jgi:hypothetical protein